MPIARSPPNDPSLSLPTKPLQLINQEDDSNSFFSRLLSKESSISNSSCRVYYGGVGGAVPFIWESEPGTPKHTFFSDNLPSLPPLAPPPSSFRRSKDIGKQPPIKARRSSFLHRLLRKIGCVSRSLPAVRSSSSSLSGFVHIKPVDYCRGRSEFSSQGSFNWIDSVNDGEEKHIAALGPGSCFGIGRRNRKGPHGCHGW